MIDAAATVAGITIADEHKEMMLRELNDQVSSYEAIRKLELKNSEQLALTFDPLMPGTKVSTAKQPMRMSDAVAGRVPKDLEDIAFASVRELAELLRTRKVSAVALTEMYIARLERYQPMLKFGITFTTDRAINQAKQADREIAAGRYRGPLHGIPWGAKDLLAVRGYPTTWGAGGFENQTIDEDATVVQRLDKAGAVLVGKLTLGALALGDKWFGGMTRNPWRPQDQGSSGSSAGPASATAAGCLGLRHRLRDAGLDLFTLHALRHLRVATDIWLRPALGCHDAVLDLGQDWPHLPRHRRLRAGDGCNPRPRRQGPRLHSSCCLQLGRCLRLAQAARWLCDDIVRTAGASGAE
jgi:hypothetical protein